MVMEENIIINLEHLYKEYNKKNVVEDFTLKIKKGEFVTILGPSGCGKTTTLRMIAGFELPTSGKILLNGKNITNLPPYKRPINTVFQRYALFPHLDVYDNVAFGLKLKKVPVKIEKHGKEITKIKHLDDAAIDELVTKALKVVDLEEMEDRDIATLSGGQQQRVAIARCIVNEPEILLLDEPLGALDLKMRKDMQLELKEMHRKLGITFIYVTHDQEEALTMSNTIVVMKDGVIQQIGTPVDIYNEPKNAFVADFIGESNIYSGTMIGKREVRFLGKSFKCIDDYPLNEKVDVVIRPEDIIILKKDKGIVNGVIESKVFKGVHYQYLIKVGKSEVFVRDTKDYSTNIEVGLEVKKENIQIMEKEYTINSYYDAWINNANQVVITDVPFDVDVRQLLPNSKLSEDGFLVGRDGKKYDLNDADVVVEIALDKVELSDDLSFGETHGTIISVVWKGDHYQYLVRTEEEEDYIVDSQYTWNANDRVGIHVAKDNIKLRLKGAISKYEV
jgi:spermidine/putrescine transport system ATP-binding protein